MFFVYSQNNSGGSYCGEYGVVIVKAESPEAADMVAESVGCYFDGVEKELDCECCGDRWYRAFDGEETLEKAVEWLKDGLNLVLLQENVWVSYL